MLWNCRVPLMSFNRRPNYSVNGQGVGGRLTPRSLRQPVLYPFPYLSIFDTLPGIFGWLGWVC
jgi:hypothetical protein